MCLGIPGMVVELVDETTRVAKVDVSGVKRNVNIALLEGEQKPQVGDYVLIHVGFALSKIDEEEAKKTTEYLRGMGKAYTDELELLKNSETAQAN